ncbi:MAG: diacylglycerol kinase [Clostridia bacterium]|nr:diacylglycerol kinase [Clostridia bacterium]
MKNKNLIDSFNNAINGIIYAIKNERNIKIHIIAAVGIIILSLFYKLSRVDFLVVCLTIGFVIVCELFNTAMEAVVDIIVDVYHPKAKVVKDVAAGAVLVSAFVSLIVAYFIFFDKVSTDLEIGLVRVGQSPIHLTVIALIITIISVLVIKAYFGKGSPLKGGMPSGHSAISFSLTTAIALLTKDAKITVLCLIISLLVVQSRLESKIHSILEVIAGALLGTLVTLLLFQLFYR